MKENKVERRNAMRKKIVAGIAILIVAVVAGAGGEPWKSKPYQQWDEKDVMAVLQTSPWAKVGVAASGAWRPMGTAPADTSNLGVAGSASDKSHVSAGVTSNQPGGLEKEIDAGAQTYNVFWWSSRTIREAAERRAVLKGATTQEEADKVVAVSPDTYQILVNAVNMATFANRGEAAFKETAFLELKKTKQKVSPTSVIFQKGADGKVVGAIFNFPKKASNGEPLISPDEKEIDFNLRIADTWVRTFFNPKQMADSQGVDL
jgi:hypothetical protein